MKILIILLVIGFLLLIYCFYLMLFKNDSEDKIVYPEDKPNYNLSIKDNPYDESINDNPYNENIDDSPYDKTIDD